MNFRQTFVLASLAATLLFGTTVAQAQQSATPLASPASQQEQTFKAVGGLNHVLVRPEGMYIECTSCGYVKEFTEKNFVPNYPGHPLKTLGKKLAGEPTTHKEIWVTIVRPGSDHLETSMTIVDPKIELQLGDLIYVTAPGGGVRLLQRASAQ
ncbi:MAG: hypothetical protein WC859_10305 [Elusimicrobiota bacterium]|jgi:hypothetical protein